MLQLETFNFFFPFDPHQWKPVWICVVFKKHTKKGLHLLGISPGMAGAEY